MNIDCRGGLQGAAPGRGLSTFAALADRLKLSGKTEVLPTVRAVRAIIRAIRAIAIRANPCGDWQVPAPAADKE